MTAYLVEADFFEYEDAYQITISLRSDLKDAEDDKAWYEDYIKSAITTVCPFTEEQLEDMDNFTEEQVQTYIDWDYNIHRANDFNFVKITPIEMDKRFV